MTPVSIIVEETFPLLLIIFSDIIQIKNPRRVYEADMQTILVISICKSAMRVVSCASLGRHYTFVVPKFNSLKYNSNHIKCVYNLLIKVKDAGDGILDKWFQLHL